jgi:peroxiredoxin
VLRDYTLQTCDGETVSIHELCGNPASLIIGYAGWCPPCNSNAPLWQTGYASRADSGLGAYFVINQNTSAAVPDATYCAGTRDRFGLTMPVLFDPTGRFHSTLGMAANDSSIVIDSDFEVIATGQYRSTSSVFADVDALLAP